MVEPWRVTQIVVDRGPGRDGSRGSGYLVAPGRVLTSAHVVAGATAVRVRLVIGQGTEIDAQVETWWTDRSGTHGTDLAVVSIPENATAGRKCEPAWFGRISDCAAVLKVEAFGFPLFKLRARPADVGRGGVPGLRAASRAFAGCGQPPPGHPRGLPRRSSPDRPAAGEPSPWEGMSGSPVWAGGRIVAVVAEHHPREGTGRLTARRIDHAYDQLSVSDLTELVELLGLPPVAAGLPDVVPAKRGQLVRLAYLTQVADIAPDQLIGRDERADGLGRVLRGRRSVRMVAGRPVGG